MEYYTKLLIGCLAQLVEQLTFNQWVTGSSPVTPTKFKKASERELFLYQKSPLPNYCQIFLEKDDYEAVLSLDENGKQKTWLLKDLIQK